MKKTVVALVLLTQGSVAAAEKHTIAFDDVPRLVRERNDHAVGADLARQSAEAGRGVLARSFLPSVEIRAGGESYRTGTRDLRSEPYGFAEAKLNLFRGGRDLLDDEAVNARASAASAEAQRVLREETRKAREAYWRLVSQRELTAILEETLAENRNNLSAAANRIRAGLATETDRIEFDMHGLELAQDLSRLKLASENTERELAILLGLPSGSGIGTPAFVDHEHKDELLTAAFDESGHPEVSSLALRAHEAALQAERFSRWWMPSVDAYASYGLNTFREREFEPMDERWEGVVGVQLSLAVFDGFIARAERAERSLLVQGLRRESLQSARELKARVEGERAELRLTHELIHQSEDALKRARSYLTRTLDEYRRGVKNSPDVLSASERNLAMRKRIAELRRDYQIARAELMSVLGQ